VRDNAKTSWRDKTPIWWLNERTTRGDEMARGNATTSWRDKTTRGRRNERTTGGGATTSWHDKIGDKGDGSGREKRKRRSGGLNR
jgi:hypothetical protein